MAQPVKSDTTVIKQQISDLKVTRETKFFVFFIPDLAESSYVSIQTFFTGLRTFLVELVGGLFFPRDKRGVLGGWG